MKLTPASNAASTMRRAAASSVRSPKVMVPRHSGETSDAAGAEPLVFHGHGGLLIGGGLGTAGRAGSGRAVRAAAPCWAPAARAAARSRRASRPRAARAGRRSRAASAGSRRCRRRSCSRRSSRASSSRRTKSASASLCAPSPGNTRKCVAVAACSSVERISCHM